MHVADFLIVVMDHEIPGEEHAVLEGQVHFRQRISFRKGRVSAISATARKLAVIIWNMVIKKVAYVNPEGYLFLDQKRKLGLVKRIKKQIDKFGLTNEEIGLSTC